MKSTIIPLLAAAASVDATTKNIHFNVTKTIHGEEVEVEVDVNIDVEAGSGPGPATKKCVCPNGTPATTTCPSDGASLCASCDDDYKLNADKTACV